MKEYIVTKEILNVRRHPDDAVEDTYAGYLNRGAIIFLGDEEVKGAIPKGGETNLWKPYNRDYFVAKDGVQLKNYTDKKEEFVNDSFNAKYIDANDRRNESKWKVNWGIVDLEIWKLWKKGYTGKGVTVAVVDTGVAKDKIGNSKAVIDTLCRNVFNETADVRDNAGHGTMAAGLIVSAGEGGIYGLAPDANLVIIKAANAIADFNNDTAAKALEYLANQEVDIISLSFILFNNSDRLLKAVNNCLAKGKILFAACGDDPGPEVFNNYPASCPGVFCIGAFQLDGLRKRVFYKAASSLSDSVKAVFPGNNLLVPGLHNPRESFDATSAATAFCAGAFAVILSGIPKEKWPTPARIIELLPKMCSPMTGSAGNRSNSEGYGVYAPLLMNLLISNNT